MKPLLEAISVYGKEACSRTFNEDISWFLEHGFVFSRPDFFVMGKPIIRGADSSQVTGLYKFPSSDCDCWHIYLMAGNIAPMFSIMPWPLPWVSFERGNELRYYQTESIHRLAVGEQQGNDND